MRPNDRAAADRLRRALHAFEHEQLPLPGIREAGNRECFVEQLVESDRRNRYVRGLVDARLSPSRMDPDSGLFDPLKAAVLFHRTDRIDEAFWMVFLFVHFGRDRHGRWRYAADVYGQRGVGARWDWDRASRDPVAFTRWMDDNELAIRERGPGGFGNHRKYQRLANTGAVVSSYVTWVGPPRSHVDLMRAAVEDSAGDGSRAFGRLYESMNVSQFGRTARFDYLQTVAELNLAPIQPDNPHLKGSTGPLAGARLLFNAPDRALSLQELEAAAVALDPYLGLGLDAIEDALCNWQKSPGRFRPFRG